MGYRHASAEECAETTIDRLFQQRAKSGISAGRGEPVPGGAAVAHVVLGETPEVRSVRRASHSVANRAPSPEAIGADQTAEPLWQLGHLPRQADAARRLGGPRANPSNRLAI
jgi:hypothetical protein